MIYCETCKRQCTCQMCNACLQLNFWHLIDFNDPEQTCGAEVMKMFDGKDQ